MANYEILARRCRLITLICLTGLLVVVAIDTVIMPTRDRSPNVVVWLILSLPLLIFVPGVRRGSVNSFAWLSFVSLLYFAQSVTSLFAPWWRWLDVVHLILTVTLFIGAMLSVRYVARARRAELQ